MILAATMETAGSCQAASLQPLPKKRGGGCRVRTIINTECELLHPLRGGRGGGSAPQWGVGNLWEPVIGPAWLCSSTGLSLGRGCFQPPGEWGASSPNQTPSQRSLGPPHSGGFLLPASLLPFPSSLFLKRLCSHTCPAPLGLSGPPSERRTDGGRNARWPGRSQRAGPGLETVGRVQGWPLVIECVSLASTWGPTQLVGREGTPGG